MKLAITQKQAAFVAPASGKTAKNISTPIAQWQLWNRSAPRPANSHDRVIQYAGNKLVCRVSRSKPLQHQKRLTIAAASSVDSSVAPKHASYDVFFKSYDTDNVSDLLDCRVRPL